jgi:hypothetical protein
VPFGDVQGNTDAAHRFAVFAEVDTARAVQPPHHAVRPDRSVQYREIDATLHGFPDRFAHGFPIVRMNALDDPTNAP